MALLYFCGVVHMDTSVGIIHHGQCLLCASFNEETPLVCKCWPGKATKLSPRPWNLLWSSRRGVFALSPVSVDQRSTADTLTGRSMLFADRADNCRERTRPERCHRRG